MKKERMGPVAPETNDDAQRAARDAFEAARGAKLFGPFERLIRSPEVLMHAQALGEYLRYRSSLGTHLSELVILVTARVWTQQYEWSLHQPIALANGITEEMADAIARGERPAQMSDEEAVCHDFSVELHSTRRVSDETYARAVALFGERGVIDLTAINGYYALLAMQLNVMCVPPIRSGPTLPGDKR